MAVRIAGGPEGQKAPAIRNSGLPEQPATGDAEPADNGQAKADSEVVAGAGTFDPVDEMAESAFRAEARSRGEVVATMRPAEAEPTEAGPLPALDELVMRIPPEVRETLDELFRAKFVAVKRVPAKALKGTS